MAQQFKNIDRSSRGPEFYPQHSHGYSQPSVTRVPEYLTPSGLCQVCICYLYTSKEKFMHIKINKLTSQQQVRSHLEIISYRI